METFFKLYDIASGVNKVNIIIPRNYATHIKNLEITAPVVADTLSFDYSTVYNTFNASTTITPTTAMADYFRLVVTDFKASLFPVNSLDPLVRFCRALYFFEEGIKKISNNNVDINIIDNLDTADSLKKGITLTCYDFLEESEKTENIKEALGRSISSVLNNKYEYVEAFYCNTTEDGIKIVANSTEGLIAALPTILEEGLVKRNSTDESAVTLGYEVLGLGPNWVFVPKGYNTSLYISFKGAKKPGFLSRKLFFVSLTSYDAGLHHSYAKYNLKTDTNTSEIIRYQPQLETSGLEAVDEPTQISILRYYWGLKLLTESYNGITEHNVEPNSIDKGILRKVSTYKGQNEISVLTDVTYEQKLFLELLYKAQKYFKLYDNKYFSYSLEVEDGTALFNRGSKYYFVTVDNVNYLISKLNDLLDIESTIGEISDENKEAIINLIAEKLSSLVDENSEESDKEIIQAFPILFIMAYTRSILNMIDNFPPELEITADYILSDEQKQRIRIGLSSYSLQDIPPQLFITLPDSLSGLNISIKIKIDKRIYFQAVPAFDKNRGKLLYKNYYSISCIAEYLNNPENYLPGTTAFDLEPVSVYEYKNSIEPSDNLNEKRVTWQYQMPHSINPKNIAFQIYHYFQNFKGYICETDGEAGTLGLEQYLKSKLLWAINSKMKLEDVEVLAEYYYNEWIRKVYGQINIASAKEYYKIIDLGNYNDNRLYISAAIKLINSMADLSTLYETVAEVKRINDLKIFWIYRYYLKEYIAKPDLEPITREIILSSLSSTNITYKRLIEFIYKSISSYHVNLKNYIKIIISKDDDVFKPLNRNTYKKIILIGALYCNTANTDESDWFNPETLSTGWPAAHYNADEINEIWQEIYENWGTGFTVPVNPYSSIQRVYLLTDTALTNYTTLNKSKLIFSTKNHVRRDKVPEMSNYVRFISNYSEQDHVVITMNDEVRREAFISIYSNDDLQIQYQKIVSEIKPEISPTKEWFNLYTTHRKTFKSVITGYNFRNGLIFNSSRPIDYTHKSYGIPVMEDIYYLPVVFTDSIKFSKDLRLYFYIPKNVTSLVFENFSDIPDNCPYLKLYYTDSLPGNFTEYSAAPLHDSISLKEFSFTANSRDDLEDGYFINRKGLLEIPLPTEMTGKYKLLTISPYGSSSSVFVPYFYNIPMLYATSIVELALPPDLVLSEGL